LRTEGGPAPSCAACECFIEQAQRGLYFESMSNLLQRLGATRPVAAIAAAVLMPIDLTLAKWTGGRLTLGSRLAGLPVVLLTTRGARTGQPRTVPLIGEFDGERIVVIGSSFGRQRQPGWYYNLRATPRATVALGGRSREYQAREATEQEREVYWKRAVVLYPGYAAYERWAGRRIPIMVLDPVVPPAGA
jgi:deazaflavin-dependent oxidoreductase (nitroreductase family)